MKRQQLSDLLRWLMLWNRPTNRLFWSFSSGLLLPHLPSRTYFSAFSLRTRPLSYNLLCGLTSSTTRGFPSTDPSFVYDISAFISLRHQIASYSAASLTCHFTRPLDTQRSRREQLRAANPRISRRAMDEPLQKVILRKQKNCDHSGQILLLTIL